MSVLCQWIKQTKTLRCHKTIFTYWHQSQWKIDQTLLQKYIINIYIYIYIYTHSHGGDTSIQESNGDSTGLKLDKNNAWDADDKWITDLRRGQNDDAVTLSQTTDITNKKCWYGQLASTDNKKQTVDSRLWQQHY